MFKTNFEQLVWRVGYCDWNESVYLVRWITLRGPAGRLMMVSESGRIRAALIHLSRRSVSHWCVKNTQKQKTGYPKRSKKFDFFPAQDRIASIETVLDARIKKKTKTTINKKKNYRVSAGLLASLRPKITLALDARQTHGRAHALTRV